MIVRDETPEEKQEHIQLLSDNGKEDTSKFQNKDNKIEAINNTFGGLPGV